jgi:dTDP-4-amino-4,6-dideoxygalactose transaminase
MDWKVRYIDYPRQYGKMRSEVLHVVDSVLSHGDLMMRQQMRDFEDHLAAFVGTEYCVGTSNCTDALRMAVLAAGIGPGDEVITVSHTFVATAAAVHHAGAAPVFVDIGEDHNMNVDLVEAAITPRTKALLPVHLNGRLCAMDKLMSIAKAHNLLVIEDSAQALGGSFQGVKGGQWGLAGCFSFYPAKLLGAYGDAGAMVTNDLAMAQRVRELRDNGRTAGGDLSGWAFNSRLDNLHAALLDLKLTHVSEWIQRRREIAALYQQHLAGISRVLLPPAPASTGDYHDVYQNYEIESENRDALRDHLREAGIETMLPWGGKGVHQFPALGLGQHRLPRTERFFERCLMLPMHCELEDEQVVFVAQTVRDFHGG